MSDHKYKLGQKVSYLGRERVPGLYQITRLLPPEGAVFQYRIKNIAELHERVVSEHEIERDA